jgi:hypothetical protein
MAIPNFRDDGYLPIGVHPATEYEVTERFGQASTQRRLLMARVMDWLMLARAVGAQRFLLDGSFVTAKLEPEDVDCVCWLPSDFEEQCASGSEEANRLYFMLVTRRPEELFGVFTRERWEAWVAFFSQTREMDRRLKGLVEVIL